MAVNPAAAAAAASAPPSIEDLYKYYGILADAKEDAGKHESVYLQIVSGTKGGVKEKQLACQFITRFFKYFSKEMDIVIDAIFDLCEDEDIMIRKSAIKDLSVLCKDCGPEHLTRIADILTQLLQTNDQQESTQVQASLLTVLKLNPKVSLNAIFNQITTAELEEIRKRAIKFLDTKLPVMFESSGGIINKEVEELLVKHVKQVLIDVDAEEFSLFIRLLTGLPSMSTLTGRQDLVNIIMAQSELDKPFDVNDTERVMILMSCIQQAIPLFSKNVQSNKFVKSFLDNVLPILTKLQDEGVKFEILKAFAELCRNYNVANAATNSQLNVGALYDLLIVYLPKPSEVETGLEPAKSEEQDAKFNFSYVECLLFSFHALARINPEFLAAGDEAVKERLKDFRLRLQYFAKGTQNYIKELRNSLSKPGSNKEENEENKIRRVALRVTTNIDLLIKDFFHNPPSYKAAINLSWKAPEPSKAIEQPAAAAATANPAKRTLSASSAGHDADSAKKKPERGIYTPPSGKYSVNSPANSNSNSNGNGNFQSKKRTFSHGSQQQQQSYRPYRY